MEVARLRCGVPHDRQMHAGTLRNFDDAAAWNLQTNPATDLNTTGAVQAEWLQKVRRQLISCNSGITYLPASVQALRADVHRCAVVAAPVLQALSVGDTLSVDPSTAKDTKQVRLLGRFDRLHWGVGVGPYMGVLARMACTVLAVYAVRAPAAGESPGRDLGVQPDALMTSADTLASTWSIGLQGHPAMPPNTATSVRRSKNIRQRACLHAAQVGISDAITYAVRMHVSQLVQLHGATDIVHNIVNLVTRTLCVRGKVEDVLGPDSARTTVLPGLRGDKAAVVLKDSIDSAALRGMAVQNRVDVLMGVLQDALPDVMSAAGHPHPAAAGALLLHWGGAGWSVDDCAVTQLSQLYDRQVGRVRCELHTRAQGLLEVVRAHVQSGTPPVFAWQEGPVGVSVSSTDGLVVRFEEQGQTRARLLHGLDRVIGLCMWWGQLMQAVPVPPQHGSLEGAAALDKFLRRVRDAVQQA